MRQYLATLHTKPPHHKKRFALLVSGTFTLIIFSLWTMTTFAPEGDTSVAVNSNEVGPLESLQAGVRDGYESARSNFDELLNTNGGSR